MVVNNSAMMVVKQDKQQKILSAVQKKFSQLSKKIERQKQQLQELKDVTDTALQRIQGELVPISEKLVIKRAHLIELLFNALLNYKLTVREKIKLESFIIQSCSMVLNRNLPDEQEQSIRQIYAQCAGHSAEQGGFGKSRSKRLSAENESDEQDLRDEDVDQYDEFEGLSAEERASIHQDDEEEKQLFKQFLKDSYGFDKAVLESVEIDLDDPFACLDELLQKQEDFYAQRKPRKKTPKQLEKQKKEEQAEALASKSLKQIYQRLVAHLHPDREKDEQQKVVKTKLLQQVTEAYQAQDLMQLIQLQVEVNQKDNTQIDQLADEQLSLYNVNLSKYSKQLEDQMYQCKGQLSELCHFDLFDQITPNTVVKKLKNDVEFIKHQNDIFQNLLRQMVDVRSVKDFLREL